MEFEVICHLNGSAVLNAILTCTRTVGVERTKSLPFYGPAMHSMVYMRVSNTLRDFSRVSNTLRDFSDSRVQDMYVQKQVAR